MSLPLPNPNGHLELFISLTRDGSSNSYPIKRSSTSRISLSSSAANITMKNSFSFSALTLSSPRCSFHASLIYRPHRRAGSVPADDVLQKDLLVFFILFASCSSKYFLASLIMLLHLSCWSLCAFLFCPFRCNTQIRSCRKLALCDISYSGQKAQQFFNRNVMASLKTRVRGETCQPCHHPRKTSYHHVSLVTEVSSALIKVHSPPRKAGLGFTQPCCRSSRAHE